MTVKQYIEAGYLKKNMDIKVYVLYPNLNDESSFMGWHIASDILDDEYLRSLEVSEYDKIDHYLYLNDYNDKEDHKFTKSFVDLTIAMIPEVSWTMEKAKAFLLNNLEEMKANLSESHYNEMLEYIESK